MAFQQNKKCRKCRKSSDGLWMQFGGGLCDKCLVKKYSLKYVLQRICECERSRVIKLYEESVIEL